MPGRKGRFAGCGVQEAIPGRELPNDTLWVVTGNNITLSCEIARRSIRVRLNAEAERPWERTGFRHPRLLRWTRENRAVLLHAALVLIQHWLDLGMPRSDKELGSFEEWAGIVGGIIEAAGVGGFLDDRDALYEAMDVESGEWHEFITTWWTAFGSKRVRVNDLTYLCDRDLLMTSVVADGNPRSRQSRLGLALRTVRDCIRAGFAIRCEPDRKTKRPVYHLEPRAGQGDNGPTSAEVPVNADNTFAGGDSTDDW